MEKSRLVLGVLALVTCLFVFRAGRRDPPVREPDPERPTRALRRHRKLTVDEVLREHPPRGHTMALTQRVTLK
jgi:hypothetical protein